MKKKNQTVLSTGQMKELVCAIVQGVPSNISVEEAQYWIGNKNELAKKIKMILKSESEGIDFIDWQNFYNNVFGIKVDFSNLQIPEKQPNFDRLIIIAKGITPQLLYDKCKELFPCWKWADGNLDKVVTSERTAEKNHYAIWVRNRIEADKELKNFSADDLKKTNIPGITLEERLVYELKYFKETKSHLDVKNITLCTGSCYLVSLVPNVRWSFGKLGVCWDSFDYRYGSLRSRRVVSI